MLVVVELVEHWTNNPEGCGFDSHRGQANFQLARCGCTLRVTSQTYSPEYITPTHTKNFLMYVYKLNWGLSIGFS